MKKLPAAIVSSLRKILRKAGRQTQEPLQRAILTILEKQVQKRGEPLIRGTLDALQKILQEEDVSLGELIDDLWLASDLVASMQTLEAARKRQLRDWVAGIGGEILEALTHV